MSTLQVAGIFAGVSLLVLVGLSWKGIAGTFKAILSGKKAMFVIQPVTGPTLGKCPKCGNPVELTPVVSGETAFTCGSCGESAKWTKV